MSEYAIDVQGLSKRFGKRVIMDNVNIRVQKGSVCGFLGPNGSGKTTTIRMLCGLLKADSGSGQCLGYDFLTQSDAIRLNTGYMTQKFGWYADLTVRENLEFVAKLFKIKNQKFEIDRTLDELGIAARQNQSAGALSGGLKQRLALAMCLVHSPKLLLLDEPTAGVDPKARREFWDIIHRLANDGVTVLVSTHYMDEAERCHELIYIAYGKILAQDSENEIISKYKLDIWDLSGSRAAEISRLIASSRAVHTVSAFGNSYHIVVRDANLLQSEIKNLGYSNAQANLKPIKTSLEDIFIHLLNIFEDERA
ncbi:ABC transporter ATP-binding protein [Campylobacter sp. RM15925]|uniref:ABC transporter ATP-binding protein n=1 Tax=Campylobacter sp. RM15925 TaxID=1705724 RepID=UPI0014761E80|nr:ABC transporter ATP-binding protein [Campylobacter sp. RM15925]